MGKFKVEKGSSGEGVIPDDIVIPDDTYFFDLIYIGVFKKRGKMKEDSYKWTGRFSEIEGQTNFKIEGEEIDLSKFIASSLTPMIPTMNNKGKGNRFGMFLLALLGGCEEQQEGSTFDLVRKKFRFKGFYERTVEGKNVYHNITKMIAGTAQEGVGCGIHGAPSWMVKDINEELEIAGLPLIEKKDEEEIEEAEEVKAEEKEVAKNPEEVAQKATEGKTETTSKKDISW